MRRWIACSRYMPPDNREVLWYWPMKSGDYAVGSTFMRDDGRFYSRNGTSAHESLWTALPTHWQCMDEPPDVQSARIE